MATSYTLYFYSTYMYLLYAGVMECHAGVFLPSCPTVSPGPANSASLCGARSSTDQKVLSASRRKAMVRQVRPWICGAGRFFQWLEVFGRCIHAYTYRHPEKPWQYSNGRLHAVITELVGTRHLSRATWYWTLGQGIKLGHSPNLKHGARAQPNEQNTTSKSTLEYIRLFSWFDPQTCLGQTYLKLRQFPFHWVHLLQCPSLDLCICMAFFATVFRDNLALAYSWNLERGWTDSLWWGCGGSGSYEMTL